MHVEKKLSTQMTVLDRAWQHRWAQKDFVSSLTIFSPSSWSLYLCNPAVISAIMLICFLRFHSFLCNVLESACVVFNCLAFLADT